MSMNDPLAGMMSKILNAETRAKSECIILGSTKIAKKVLDIMQIEGYIGKYTEIKDTKGNLLKINLSGGINGCGVIKPRFAVKKDNYEKFEKRFLPAKEFGVLIVSTNKGLLSHKEAKQKNLGGKLIAYCY